MKSALTVAKCRWILQSKSALSGWYRTVSSLWHNIIWNDIEQHAFGAKLLAHFSFDSTKFIALIPRSFKPLWHKLRLAFFWGGTPPLSFPFFYQKLLLTVYATTSHLSWVTKGNRKEDVFEWKEWGRPLQAKQPAPPFVLTAQLSSGALQSTSNKVWLRELKARWGEVFHKVEDSHSRGRKEELLIRNRTWCCVLLQSNAFPYMASCLPPPPPAPNRHSQRSKMTFETLI